MPTNSMLVVTANPTDNTATFRLLDGHGGQRSFRHTDFNKIPEARRRGLFDLRNYLQWYVERKDEAIRVAEIGVCIAEEVLGAEIRTGRIRDALLMPITRRRRSTARRTSSSPCRRAAVRHWR